MRNHRNETRVAKIVELLDLLDKSAQSNKTPAAEVKEFLTPVLVALNGMGVEQSRRPAAPWATVRQMAEEAPLKDLTVAMAVYLNRIDEALNK